MDVAAVLLVVSSLLVTLVTAIVSKPSMTPEKKRMITVIASVVIGTITVVVNGQIEGIPPDVIHWLTRILTTVAIVAVGSQGAYLLFKGSAEKVEEKVLGDAPGVAPFVKPPS